MHRLPRLLGGVQGRARGPPGRRPHLGQVRREGRVPRDAPHLPGHPLQPLRRRALRRDLPHHRALPAAGRDRGLRPRAAASAARPACRAAPTTRSTSTRSTETAAKCNFCAHKVEVGLEPPCVTVCPTQAIVAGDLDDPGRRSSQLMGRIPVQVRKPEKGTRPKVFYIEGDAAALVPSAAPPPSDYMWAQRPAGDGPRRPTRGGGRAAPDLRRARAAPELLGLEGLGVPVDEVARRGRVPGAGPRRALPRQARRRGRPSLVAARLPGPDRRSCSSADLRQPRAVPLDADEAAVAVVAGARLLRHRRVRRCCSALHLLAALAARRAAAARSPA